MVDVDLLVWPPDVSGARRLGPRYLWSMQALMYRRLKPCLAPGVTVLDLGGGRRPFLPPQLRPPGTHYVGTDVAIGELKAAGPCAYDHYFHADVSEGLPTTERFDIVLSWQVLEHVSSMAAALRNINEVLKPGGHLFAQLSGSRALVAILGRVIPYRRRLRLMKWLLGATEEDHFPTAYDSCTSSELSRLLTPWSSSEIIPYFRGGNYFDFAALPRRLYLAYENILVRRRWDDLASHYLILARR